MFAGTRILNHACSTSGNDVEFGFPLRFLKAIRIAYGKNPAPLTATGIQYLLSTLGFGAGEKAVAAETLALFEFTDHNEKNEFPRARKPPSDLSSG